MTIDTIHHHHPSPWMGLQVCPSHNPVQLWWNQGLLPTEGQAHQLLPGDPSPVVHPASSLLEAWPESNRWTPQGPRAPPAPRTRGPMLGC